MHVFLFGTCMAAGRCWAFFDTTKGGGPAAHRPASSAPAQYTPHCAPPSDLPLRRAAGPARQVLPRPAFLREFRRLRGTLPYAAAAAATPASAAASGAGGGGGGGLAGIAADGPAPLRTGELIAHVREEDL
jgi:hypothetical protein